jgi:glycosyltransferase involved in cell wall biosynthesis
MREELERDGWQVELITLERLPFLFRLLPHIVGAVFNVIVRPMGFYYKGRMTRWLYQRFFNSQVRLRVFEDIYVSWNSRVPSVTVLHAVWSDNLQSTPVAEEAAARLVSAEERLIDSISHPLSTVSDGYRSLLLRTHPGSVGLREIAVIPLGLNLAEFERGNRSFKKSLVYCGSLEPRKNVQFLLAVFGTLQKVDPEYRLALIGNGPERSALERFCEENRLEVAFLGRLERAEVLQELRRHSVYVHTSTKESFSFALLEAKLSGLTTVAYGGLEVPPEFIDVPVSTFDERDWLDAIRLATTLESTAINTAEYSSREMMLRTVELAGRSIAGGR